MLNLKRRFGRIVTIAGLLSAIYSPLSIKAENTFLAIPQIVYEDHETDLRFKLKQSYSKTGNKQGGELEFLVGKEFGKYLEAKDLKFVIYADTKSDLRETLHLGAALEADQRVADILHLGLKLNHYFGLDKKSKDHLSYNPYIMLDLSKHLSIGAWDLGKLNYKDKTGFDYVGPFAMYRLTKHICVIGHYGVDLKNRENRLFYLKLDLTFGKEKSNEKQQEDKEVGK
jgi:hypothetical protein